MPMGSVMDFLSKSTLTLRQILELSRDVAVAMIYLCSKGIVHGLLPLHL
jgi:hypothetical protein